MTHTAIPSSAEILIQLASPAARAIMLASAAGLALAAFRVKATSARLFAWKAVLYSALAMPLLGWVLPEITIPTPTIPSLAAWQLASQRFAAQSRDVQPSTANVSPALRADSTASDEAGNCILRPDQPRSAARPNIAGPATVQPIQWPLIAATVYFSIAVLLLLRMGIGLILGRRLMHTAKDVREPQLTMSLARGARSFGLALIPGCAESEVISVPVTMGVLRPAILLPTNWRDWDSAKLDAVVAHELSHVARRDALTQHLALLHRAVFWFSPLAWWLDRHLAELAEQAGDEAALSCGAIRTITPTLCWDFSKRGMPRPDGSGGRASRWPRAAKQSGDWNEFLSGTKKELLPWA